MKVIAFLLILIVGFTVRAENDCASMTTSEKIRHGCDVSVNYKLGAVETRKDCETMSVSEKISAECNLDALYLGKTTLIKAITDGNKEDVKLLLRKGADINLKDSSGNTALMVAIAHGKSDIFNILMEANANVATKNNMGHTALSLAQSSEDIEMEVLILSKMRSLKFCDFSYEEINEYFFVAKDLTEIRASNTKLENLKTELQRLSKEENYNSQCGEKESESEDSPESDSSEGSN